MTVKAGGDPGARNRCYIIQQKRADPTLSGGTLCEPSSMSGNRLDSENAQLGKQFDEAFGYVPTKIQWR